MLSKPKMLKRLAIFIALATAAPSFAQTTAPTTRNFDSGVWGNFAFQATSPRAHDPVVIADGDYVYCYSTGRGLGGIRSRDLYTWQQIDPPMYGLPDWATQDIPGARGAWAPDISYFNGKFHLYYAVSLFGKNTSVIGLATNSTLNPDDPKYQWNDDGKVFQSVRTDNFNAIDPNLAMDEHNQPWLAFGSYWSGIKIIKLDARTGKPAADAKVIGIASRPGDKAIEGPFIVRHGNWFYQFVSFDACCKGVESTYRTMVGRSRQITGPYEDFDGTPMLRGGGTTVLASQGNVRGPGHNGMLMNYHGRDWIAHHFYDANDNGRSHLQIRPIYWDANGWPSAGEAIDKPVDQFLATKNFEVQGTWDFSVNFEEPKHVIFAANHSTSNSIKWSRDGSTVKLEWNANRKAVCEIAPDGRWFAGRDSEGKVIRGKRVVGDSK